MNFTIEFWSYLNSQSTFVIYDPRTAEPQLVPVIYTASGQLRFYANGTDAIIGSTLSALTWYHIALTRSGTSTKLFVNGTQSGSTYTDSNNYIQTRPVIGVYPGNLTSYFNGYISSLRILKGTAQYTATFTPPTSPLTAITNTSLLLNITNASIIDSTAKNDLETVGDAQISTSVKKFGTGSLKFDGTGDYLKAPNNSNFQMGSGSFTIEMWLYTPSLPSAYKRVFGTTAPTISAATDEGINLEITNTNKMSGTCVVGSTYYSVTDTTDIPTSTWTHWALVRNGSTLTLYRDGTSVSTTSISGTSNWSTTFDVYVGRWVGSSARDYNGYIDDLRITKGVARYTSNFTPPAAQLPSR